jgi:protein-disulfide isomerase
MRLTRRSLAAALGALAPAASLRVGRAFAADAHEVTIGKADAPVTIVEYFSMTCPHCAHFAETTLPALEKRYIDTGKIKLVLRDFPLDEVALKAALIAHCGSDDRYEAFVKEMFKTQETWIRAPDPLAALKELGKVGGLTDAEMDACLADKAMENAVLQSRLDAQSSLEVDSTPTLIVNGTKYPGDRSIEDLADIIDPLLK